MFLYFLFSILPHLKIYIFNNVDELYKLELNIAYSKKKFIIKNKVDIFTWLKRKVYFIKSIDNIINL